MRIFDRVYSIRRTPAGVTCTVGGRPVDPRFDLRNHSPSGFEFGYGGSGPAQLALAILADCCDDATALECYQAFKWCVVAHVRNAGFDLTATQIHDVVAAIRSDRAAENYRNN